MGLQLCTRHRVRETSNDIYISYKNIETGVLFKVTQAYSKKEIRVLLSGVEPKAF